MSDLTTALQKLYVAYFNRPADPDGLAYWGSVLNAGSANLNSVSAAFARSPEYQNIFANLDATQIVTRIYHNLFARAPDESGLAYWRGALSAGIVTVDRIVAEVANGAQPADSALLQAKIVAADVYSAALAAGKLNYAYLAALDQGKLWLDKVVSAETGAAAIQDIAASLRAVAPAQAAGEPLLASPRIGAAELIGFRPLTQYIGDALVYQPEKNKMVLDFSSLAAPLKVEDKFELTQILRGGWFLERTEKYTITAVSGEATYVLNARQGTWDGTYEGIVGTAFDDVFHLGPTLGNPMSYQLAVDDKGIQYALPNGNLSMLDGGAGIDTLLLDTTPAKTILRKTTDGLLQLDDTYLLNIENLRFADGTVARVADLMAAYDQKKLVWTATAAALLSPTGTGTPSGQKGSAGQTVALGTAGADHITTAATDSRVVMAGNGGDVVTRNPATGAGGTDTIPSHWTPVIDYSGSAQGIVARDNSTSKAGEVLVTRGAGTDSLIGFSAIDGSNFDDVFYSGSLLGTINGGRGIDTVYFDVDIHAARFVAGGDGRSDTVGISDLTATGFRGVMLTSIEKLVLKDGLTLDQSVYSAAMLAPPAMEVATFADGLFLSGASAQTLSTRTHTAILGSAGADRLVFGGASALFGGAGNDVFAAAPGASGASHFIYGDGGNDTVDYSAVTADIVIVAAPYETLFSSATFKSSTGAELTDSFNHIERFIGGKGNDVFTGAYNLALTFDGGDGIDTYNMELNAPLFALDKDGNLMVSSSGVQFDTVKNIERLLTASGTVHDGAQVLKTVKELAFGPGSTYSLETVRRKMVADNPDDTRAASTDAAPFVVKDGAGLGTLDLAKKSGGVYISQTAGGAAGATLAVEDYTFGGPVFRPGQLTGIARITGTDVDDVFDNIGPGIARIDGGQGIDTVYLSTKASETFISINADGSLTINGTVFANVENFKMKGSALEISAFGIVEQINWNVQHHQMPTTLSYYDMVRWADKNYPFVMY
jgi:hypothetical protein